LTTWLLLCCFRSSSRSSAIRLWGWFGINGYLQSIQLSAIPSTTQKTLREGSFFRVLEAYKGPVDVKLVEQINQVRKYRNWVAHGRRGKPDANVEPRDAYDRLQAFLTALGLT
jgi:hypothetical protein